MTANGALTIVAVPATAAPATAKGQKKKWWSWRAEAGDQAALTSSASNAATIVRFALMAGPPLGQAAARLDGGGLAKRKPDAPLRARYRGCVAALRRRRRRVTVTRRPPPRHHRRRGTP